MDELFKVRLLERGIVEVVIDKRLFLDINATERINMEVSKLVPRGKTYQLVLANAPYAVDPEMRHAIVKKETGTNLGAIAWISPDQKANAEQEAIVSKLPMPFPIRFFNDREKGLAWLRSLAGKETD
jgi:hypothetical protein